MISSAAPTKPNVDREAFPMPGPCKNLKKKGIKTEDAILLLIFLKTECLGQFNCISFVFCLLANTEAVIITASLRIRNRISPKEAISEYRFFGDSKQIQIFK